MELIKFEKNNVMTDYFWQVMVEKRCIHLDTPLMKCLGYEGEIRSQQQSMKKFLKSNGVQLLEIHSNDERVKDYPTIIQEISKLPNKGAIAKKKWLIVEPREFKKIIMKLNTKSGNMIREYYVVLEEFIKLYFEYSLRFKEEKHNWNFKIRIDNLKHMMLKMKIDSEESLDIAVEDRSLKVIFLQTLDIML